MEQTSLERNIAMLVDRWNLLAPVMLQMGIIDDLLDRKVVIAERDGESYTLMITREGVSVQPGEDSFSHAAMRTTGEQWGKIFSGAKPYAAIFRFELAPVRDPVNLREMALVERFSSVLQALVSLPIGQA